jgi:hypothetical protein
MSVVDKVIYLITWRHVSAVQQPSSGQRRTQIRYTQCAHYLGPHMVYISGTSYVGVNSNVRFQCPTMRTIWDPIWFT